MTKPLQILLVDDDEDDREFFAIALEECDLGIELHTAPGCAEAIVLLESGRSKPDFIFLDLNMPKTDGRQCLAHLKASAATKKVPVVIYTTSSETLDKTETRQLGAIDFITKDSKITDLTNTLTRFFNHHLQDSLKN